MGSALSRASDPEVGLLQSITELKTREDIHAEINALADRIDEDDSVPESIRSVIARARKEVAKREYIIDMEHDVEPQIVGNEMLIHNQDNPIVKDLLFACARKLMRQGYNFMEDIYQ